MVASNRCVVRKCIIIGILFYLIINAFHHAEARKNDIFGIGRFDVEFVTFVSDDSFKRDLKLPYGFEKGSIYTIDDLTWHELYGKLNNVIIRPGGDVGVILSLYSLIGGNSTLETIMSNDEYGRIILKEMKTDGFYINHNIDPFSNLLTPTKIVFITQDGKITIVDKNVDKGVLAQHYIRYHLLKDYKNLLVDLSMWDDGLQSYALMRALKSAKRLGVKSVAILPQGDYVKKYRRKFIELFDYIDILILHEKNVKSLFGVHQLNNLHNISKRYGMNIVYTQGRRGATIIDPVLGSIVLPTSNIDHDKILDKSGGQAAFTAGFLYGINNGLDIKNAGKKGIYLAEYIIQKIDYKIEDSVLNELSK